MGGEEIRKQQKETSQDKGPWGSGEGRGATLTRRGVRGSIAFIASEPGSAGDTCTGAQAGFPAQGVGAVRGCDRRGTMEGIRSLVPLTMARSGILEHCTVEGDSRVNYPNILGAR